MTKSIKSEMCTCGHEISEHINPGGCQKCIYTCPSFRPAEPRPQKEKVLHAGKWHEKDCAFIHADEGVCNCEPSPQKEENCFICRKPIEAWQTASTIHTGCRAICTHNPCEDCVATTRQKTISEVREMIERLKVDPPRTKSDEAAYEIKVMIVKEVAKVLLDRLKDL